MKNIVSQQWLIDNLSKEGLIILDVRGDLNEPDLGFREYKKSHIRGAQFVNLEETMTGELGIHGGRHPLPNMEKFIEDMKMLGVNDDSIIVIYDNGDLAIAGRLWWLLKYIGKSDVFILEGGMKKWLDNNLEVTSEVVKPEPSNSLSLNVDHSMQVDMRYVKAAIDSNSTAIIDSRASERYSGEVEPIDRVAGHIPNALNYPWMNLVSDGKIMCIEDLINYFEPLKKFEEVIVHCGSGITGTVNILFMEEVGLNPKLYVGGYSDWVSYDDNLVIEKNK
ncbi:sulfurtransferase [Alkaliphilus sp. MSJ-5]|uniref:Sulfurtransferase n=1 Tax=Alkaliphilus flagellatus TaxID=2841507 RepID=A0ABS6G492_9FIRM|nr:sulfurtransferase [Alkaliphilus flagellatus]MBU5676230.1 sulfurtransferase [Alkaliphilus flagellatus]